MTSAFTPILNGQTRCHKILEDDRYLAFLERRPLKTGHTLVIPKREIDYLFDLDDDALSGLMLFAKKVAVAIRSAVPCQKVAVLVYGLQVRHAHVHLIPVHGEAGELDLSKMKEADESSLENTASSIRHHLEDF